MVVVCGFSVVVSGPLEVVVSGTLEVVVSSEVVGGCSVVVGTSVEVGFSVVVGVTTMVVVVEGSGSVPQGSRDSSSLATKKVRRKLPPQLVLASPGQGMLHSESSTFAVSLARTTPHQHSPTPC